MPANAAGPSPEMTLSYTDLGEMVQSGAAPTTAFQQAYFSWLAWTTAIVTVIMATAAIMLSGRAIAIATAVLSAVGLVFLIFGTKGPLSWAAYADQAGNIRMGAILMVVGYVVTICTAAVSAARRPTVS
ncbi:hypothetical protein GCM10023197_45160 [Gordonia humi]